MVPPVSLSASTAMPAGARFADLRSSRSGGVTAEDARALKQRRLLADRSVVRRTDDLGGGV